MSMSTSRDKAVRKHRRRLKEQGFRRVEVEAAEPDASLIRQLAKVLRGGGEEAEAARLLLGKIVSSKRQGLKDLLASAPLEGISITRTRDPGRTIEL